MPKPLYLYPEWPANRQWDYCRVTDQQISAYDYKLAELEKHNQKLYSVACQDQVKLVNDAIRLHGAAVVKYLRRQRIPRPPEIGDDHRKWVRKVYRARKEATEAVAYEAKMAPVRTKRREYSRRYYVRKKQEAREINDAFKLEGVTEKEVWQMIWDEQHESKGETV